MEYSGWVVYFLYDTESPLAKILSDAYINILPEVATIREFQKPPQPLYRGGMVNPENPHIQTQNRIITSHNVSENIEVWLDHHKKLEVKSEEVLGIDPQIESIKNELISLPKDSIVILVQSTNFRLSTFRIRLELFHRWIHVVEHNHLAYIPENQFDTFINSLMYRTDEYLRLENTFSELAKDAKTTRIQSVNGSNLVFDLLRKFAVIQEVILVLKIKVEHFLLVRLSLRLLIFPRFMESVSLTLIQMKISPLKFVNHLN